MARIRYSQEIKQQAVKLVLEDRHTLRQKQSLPQLDCIFAKARTEVGKYTDKELIGSAYQYLLNHE